MFNNNETDKGTHKELNVTKLKRLRMCLVPTKVIEREGCINYEYNTTKYGYISFCYTNLVSFSIVTISWFSVCGLSLNAYDAYNFVCIFSTYNLTTTTTRTKIKQME